MDASQLFQNAALPPDISAEAQSLSMRQQIMQQLLARSMAPTPMPENWGRRASPVSPLAAIAQGIGGYVGGRGLNETNIQAADLARRYNQSITDTLMASQQARQGTPGGPGAPEVPATGPTENASPSAATPATSGTAAQPGNASVANALLVNHPATRALGMEMLKRNMEMQAFTDAANQMNAGGGGAPAAAPQAAPAAPPVGAGTVLTPEASATVAQPAAPTARPAGFGGPAGGQPMAFWLQADPTGGKYLAQLAEDQKPIASREGDVIRPTPGGGAVSIFQQPKMAPGVIVQRDARGQVTSASAIPGFKEAASGIEGAEAGAKAAATNPYEIEMVKQADGSLQPKFKWQLPGYPGGALAAAGGSASAPTPPATGIWSTVPRRFIPQGVGQSTYNETIAKEQGTAAAKLSDKLGTAADAANQRLALNQQALDLVDKSDTGPLAARIGEVKNWLTSRFGVPETAFQNTPSATIELQKDLVNAATQKAKQQFGSRITQSEVMLMLNRGAPNVDMTKAAMKYLISTDSVQSQYQIDQAQHLGQYTQVGGDPFRFEAWHAKAFPMTDYLQKAGLGPQGKVVAPNAPTGGGPEVKAMPSAIPGAPIPAVGARHIPESQQPAKASTAGVPSGVDPELWQYMTPQEKALWQK